MTEPVSQAEYQQMVANRMTEAQLQKAVEAKLRAFGWLWYHTYRSDRSQPGFPDICALRGSHLLFVELKSEKGRVTPDQRRWLEGLYDWSVALLSAQPIYDAPNLSVHVWRPMQLLSGDIDKVLQ